MTVPDACCRLEGLPRERVHERLARLGCSAVSVEELLATVLGDRGGGPEGLAARVLAQHDGLVGLATLEPAALRRFGLHPGAAARLAATFELAKRLAQARRRDRPRLATPEQVMAALGASMLALPHEELWCLPLDPQSRLIGEPRVVSKGDVDGTDAGPRAFYRLALQAGATSAIAVHNHPSGDASPSAADREVTRRLVIAGRAIDLALADHLVMGDGCRFSSLRRQNPELFGH
jgi:DNA repair protein RadC